METLGSRVQELERPPPEEGLESQPPEEELESSPLAEELESQPLVEGLESQPLAEEFESQPPEEELELPSPEDEVDEDALPGLPSRAVEPAHIGKIIAVVGSKGGCGVTSLTVNLGTGLARNHSVCVIDLAGSNGDVAAYLDLTCAHQLAELFGAEHIDAALLEAMSTRHRSNVVVLPQPTNLADVALLDPDGVARVIDAASLTFDIVLIDCGAHLEEATLTAVLRADVIALVTSASIPSVRNANRRLLLFDQMHVDRKRVRLIVNHLSRHEQLSLDQIEEHLKRGVTAEVRGDPQACARAEMQGVLLAELPGRHKITDDIIHLGEALTGEYWEPPQARSTLSRIRAVLTGETP